MLWVKPRLVERTRISTKTVSLIFIILRCSLSGWGQTTFGGEVSNVLQEVAIPVWEHDQCVSAFSQPIFKTNICAASFEGGKDSCLVNRIIAVAILLLALEIARTDRRVHAFINEIANLTFEKKRKEKNCRPQNNKIKKNYY